MLWLLDWMTGDLVDVGWWRPLLFMFLGVLLSVPYGWAWVKGRAPLPPKPAALVPQAAVQQEEGHDTYVFVGPVPETRYGLARKVGELRPISWFFYTLLWRWPLLLGDTLLTAFWRGMTRLFGFNGGPSIKSFDPSSADQVEYPEDRPPPGSRTF
jgi:hypothetical protein